MVTYLKTLIYIQCTSCAGLRVWLAILDIVAGFKCILGIQCVRLEYLEAVLGIEKRPAEREGDGRDCKGQFVALWELC
jgi:hypothetical protein